MNCDDRYPIGTEVQIVDPGKLPGGWNSEMMHLIGRKALIVSNNDDLPSGFCYKLDQWNWSWRHMDLMLVDLSNPNTAFRVRKHAL